MQKRQEVCSSRTWVTPVIGGTNANWKHDRTRLGQVEVGLSMAARRRLKWLDYYRACGGNAPLTRRHFDISAQTFYRWLHRYRPSDLTNHREPFAAAAGVCASRVGVRRWSRRCCSCGVRYPCWGKDKLAVLLRGTGHAVSVSMLGRILTRLKRRGRLVEPVSNAISARRPAPPRPYAIRNPRD